MGQPANFNIRVYGIWIKDGQVLLCRENSGDIEFTKFPGGGVDLGEGIVDTLKREFKEELDFVPDEFELIYINPFYQKSAFSDEQLVSIYYKVHAQKKYIPKPITEKRWDKTFELNAFWVPLSELKPELLTFPVDKEVARLITM